MSAAGVWGWTLAFVVAATVVAKWLVFPAIGRTAAARQPFSVRLVVSLAAGCCTFAVLFACWHANVWQAAIEREDPATIPWSTVDAVGGTVVYAFLFCVPLALLGSAIRACVRPPDARACAAMLAIVVSGCVAWAATLFVMAVLGALPRV